ncbi:MAG: hypothetical protein QM478_01375 [Flavobacteriaceae bacterium]
MKKKVILLVIASVCIFNTTAQRNYKYENFGNRSILLNGNVTGSVDDLGATYYNPARLALVENPVFLINAKIYQLSNIKLGNVTIDGEDLSTTNFDGLPSMVAGSFKIKKLEGHHFAYSFFSRNRSDLSLGYNSKISEVDGVNLNSMLDKYISTTSINNKLRENWFGLSWATSISPNFSIGASLFVSIYKFEIGHKQQINVIDDFDQVGHYNSAISFRQNSYGLFGKIGAAWVFPKFDLGVNLSLPYLEIYSVGKFNYEEFLSNVEGEDDIFTFNDYDDLDAKRKYPLGISVGAGVPIRRHKLHIDLSYNSKVNNYSKIDIPNLVSETEDELPTILFDEELKQILNIGLGTEIYISDKLNLYGSFSTDYSPFISKKTTNDPVEQPAKTINFSTDYYHYGFGVNVSHKWANFILGTIYSSGNSKIEKTADLPISPININEFSKVKINRWRFVIGIEILFIDESKLNKYGINPKLF